MLPPIEYIPDSEVNAVLDEQLRALLSTCFTGPHNERFKRQRFFDPARNEWCVRPDSAALVARLNPLARRRN